MRVVLDWQTEQAMVCRGCGGFIDETMAPGADDDYEAHIVICHRCASMDHAERDYREGNGPTAGMRRRSWRVDD